MSNLEQFPINKVPENSNEAIEEGIKEKVESEPKQELENTQVENAGVKKEEKIQSSKGGFSRALKNTLAALTLMSAATNTPPAKSAEAELADKEIDKTEQMVSEENSVEMQGQKAKIIKPFEVLSEADWKSVTDTAGYVSLYDLAELIRRRVPGTYYINVDVKTSYRNILKQAKQHRIIDDHQIFCIDSYEEASPLGPRFGMISAGRDQFGNESTSVWHTYEMPDRLIYSWFEANKTTIEMIFATKN